MPVFCKKQGYELRMYLFVASEVSTEETAYEAAIDRSVIAWEMYVFE